MARYRMVRNMSTYKQLHSFFQIFQFCSLIYRIPFGTLEENQMFIKCFSHKMLSILKISGIVLYPSLSN